MAGELATQERLRQLPHGAGRWFFRAPIYLYRVGLGWLLGRRFLLLNHIGRKSGLPRQAVLEVVDHEQVTDTYFVASGYGRTSHWFKNLQAQPEVVIQVGSRELAVTAEILDPEQSGEKMVAYARHHPQAAQQLLQLVGLALDGTEEGYRQAGREHIPFVALHPRRVLREQPTTKEMVVPLLLLGSVLAGVATWRRARKREA